jgi:hypothetical protein
MELLFFCINFVRPETSGKDHQTPEIEHITQIIKCKKTSVFPEKFCIYFILKKGVFVPLKQTLIY